MVDINCVVKSRSKVGEGAVWDEINQVLWWVDIPFGLIHRFDPSNGENVTYEFGEPVGCLAVREVGGLIVAAKNGFYFFAPTTGEKEFLCNPEAHLPDNRFNDGATDNQGRFWAGTMKDAGERQALGRFYRFGTDHTCTAWGEPVYTTNGMSFSPDGRIMYFSDSDPSSRTIWAADYDPDTGQPSNPRVFFDTKHIAGRPDGGTVDADGCYWMAGVGGWQLVRITPQGKIDRIIDMPVEKPSKPMFGGKNLDTLFVTSIGGNLTEGRDQPDAGGLFAISGLGVKGINQTRYKG